MAVQFTSSFSTPGSQDFSTLKERAVRAYQASYRFASEDKSEIWDSIFERNKATHDAILSGGNLPEFDHPASSNLFYGFEQMYDRATRNLKARSSDRQRSSQQNIEAIYLLADAVGARCADNPESWPPSRDPDSIETTLQNISRCIGIELDFPNPFPDEFGIETTRGIVSYRAVNAIYQAFRIKQLSKQFGDRVLEIGAGLGRTAYYAKKMGIGSYSIIDLPMTNLAQANFLGRALSEKAVALFGEEASADQVRILPVSEAAKFGPFDILVNVDSLTEMGLQTATAYAEMFIKNGKVFWSVNHEANPFTVSDIPGLKNRRIGRFPYWLRRGYVEEIFRSS